MESQPAAKDQAYLSGQGTNRAFYLPRLPREYYQADAVVHWTMPIAKRGIGWLNAAFHAHFRETMLHAAAREGLLCPIYCLMPDHIHLVWMGLRRDSDQRNGMKFLREYLAVLIKPHQFQHQAHDNVLREQERKRDAFAKVCFYILANPVRASLIDESGIWPYRGSIIPGYPAMDPVAQDFWPLFWKLYFAAREPDAGDILRPSH
jgi:putative transposase